MVFCPAAVRCPDALAVDPWGYSSFLDALNQGLDRPSEHRRFGSKLLGQIEVVDRRATGHPPANASEHDLAALPSTRWRVALDGNAMQGGRRESFDELPVEHLRVT